MFRECSNLYGILNLWEQRCFRKYMMLLTIVDGAKIFCEFFLENLFNFPIFASCQSSFLTMNFRENFKM
jgi:hypothetical protein